jgi:hypothetical protein
MNNQRTTLMALMAVLLTVAGVWFTHRAVPLTEASWEDVLIEAQRGAYRVITTEELAGRYREDPGSLLLVDTRQDWEFRTGHIKGAVSFPMEPTWWSRWRKASALEALLGGDRDRLIVFY